MQVGKLLQNTVLKSCGIHKKRAEVLLVASETLVECQDLSVVGLGRGIINKIKPKYNINRMDRLIGNKHLYEEANLIYSAVANFLIGNKKNPILIVDWSSATEAERFQLLRVSLACNGRSMTIYEEVHPLCKYNNPIIHAAFLKKLKQIIPADCKPTIVTDAGFGIPWFKQVEALGWNYVGRLINKSKYSTNEEEWLELSDLLSYKLPVIERLGQVSLTLTNKFKCYLQVYKSPPAGRVKKNKYGDKSGRGYKNAKSNRQAWVLASSLGDSELAAQKIHKIYCSRMQIEESFRDLKSYKYGFGFKNSRTMGILRLTNLLLIALIATLIAWVLGLCTINKNEQYGFQTNSIKDRKVLSVFYTGFQVIRHLKRIKFVKKDFLNALQQLKEIYLYI